MGLQATVVWFRQDLRLADNPALAAAVERGGPVLPLYIWAPEEEGRWAPGAASRFWLHQSLAALGAELERRGSRLLVQRGAVREVLEGLITAGGIDAVYWNERYAPAARQQEQRLARALGDSGIAARAFSANLLLGPDELRTGAGQPYRVFTPYYRALMRRFEPEPPLAAPRRFPAPTRWPRGTPLADLRLEPRVDWAGGIGRAWTFGEQVARKRLAAFVRDAAAVYDAERDRLDHDGTSRLSPHLHFGEISPHQIWHEVRQAQRRTRSETGRRAMDAFLRQIAWREFAHQMLVHFPQTPERPLHEAYAAFPWRRDRRGERAWQRGETGFPIVDAAMRQLWETGWMHNRARMVVASFLVKDLLIPWQRGAAWFWDTLVDADLANNTFGWQWVAGCGADAAPFFRVFNPVLQGRKFDPRGDYVRRYVPALARLEARWIHEPWSAPESALAAAGVALGGTYPRPIVDHYEARDRALEALAEIQGGGT